VVEKGPVETSQAANLPARLTSLVGRVREITELGDLLREPEVRLLTLTGSGGSGKTRLALAVAGQMLDAFEDGVFFADLAPISDAVLVPSTIASALSLQGAGSTGAADDTRGYAARPRPGAEPEQLTLLAEVLRDRRLLIVLDNFEHVQEAAPQVDTLLQACPGLKFLVTSRSALRLEGEREFPVPLLTLPDPDHLPSASELAQYEAVELFVQRARAVAPHFTLTDANASAVAEICIRLDGLPLAIELAAARVRLLPPQALLGRLGNRLALLTGGPRNLPTRQQTLRATLDWSYGLLTPEEQRLFAQLSALVGAWTLEAAEAVVGSEGTIPDILEGLASLIDKSLLLQEETAEGEGRFRMLETIRDYASERLEASGEAATTKRRHVAYFLALAEEAAPHLHGPQQAEWLVRLEREHDNLRLALIWALESGDAPTAVRLGAALWRFWWILGHLGEGQRWLAGVLKSSKALSASVRIRALSGAWGIVSHALPTDPDSYAQANAFFSDSLDLCRELGDALGVALSLGNLGQVAAGHGDVERGVPLLEESLLLLRELGDRERIASALSNLGAAALQAGDTARGEEALQESLAIRRELNDRPAVAASLTALARAAAHQGDHRAANSLLAEALTISRELGANPIVAEAIDELARLALASQKAEQAARLFGAAASFRKATGAVLSSTAEAALEHDAAAARATLGEEQYAAAWAAGGMLSREAVVAQAVAVLSISPLSTRSAPPTDPAYPLTAREAQVAVLIARGKTNRDIAEELVIAEGTTERHVANILGKLAFNSRSQVAAWAAERGLLEQHRS
jgi:non-specific serine/threonine protein kinase